MKTIFALSMLCAALTSFAQDSHHFVFTGQVTEAFNLTGLVSQPYEGTCYENEQWTTEDCSYDSYGNYSCRPVYHGSLTPYDCTQNGWFPGTGAQAVMPTRIVFSSTLKNPKINFNVVLDKQTAAPVITTSGLLPAGTVLGLKQGTRRWHSDETFSHESYVKLTTNEDLKKNLAEQVRQVSLDLKNKRLKFRVLGNVGSRDQLVLDFKTRGGLFRSGGSVLRLTGTLSTLRPSSTNTVPASEVRAISNKEVEVEIDLISALPDSISGTPSLEFTQTQVLDEAFTWTGVIGPISKTLKSSVRVIK